MFLAMVPKHNLGPQSTTWDVWPNHCSGVVRYFAPQAKKLTAVAAHVKITPPHPSLSNHRHVGSRLSTCCNLPCMVSLARLVLPGMAGPIAAEARFSSFALQSSNSCLMHVYDLCCCCSIWAGFVAVSDSSVHSALQQSMHLASSDSSLPIFPSSLLVRRLFYHASMPNIRLPSSTAIPCYGPPPAS